MAQDLIPVETKVKQKLAKLKHVISGELGKNVTYGQLLNYFMKKVPAEIVIRDFKEQNKEE